MSAKAITQKKALCATVIGQAALPARAAPHEQSARPKGYTLLELMLVVAIIGILASLAVGFSGVAVNKQRLKTTARAIQSAISLARANAVQMGSTATFSIANNVIYAYKDVNKNNAYDSGDILIYQYPAPDQPPLPATTRVYLAPSGVPQGTYPAGFNLEGLYFDSTGSLATATFCVRDSQLSGGRAVQMSITGACRTLALAAGDALCF